MQRSAPATDPPMPLDFLSPHPGPFGTAQTAPANAPALKRLRRALFGLLPFPVLASDVGDIVYANWVVPAAGVAPFVPPGVTLAEVDGQVVLTILTYRHGHFGPALAGPLRRLFPSPLQSNWRVYVAAIDGRPPPEATVLFLANVFDGALYALGTRLCSDVMLAHHARHFVHRYAPEGWRSGAHGPGSAPSWEVAGGIAARPALPEAFRRFFPDLPAALAAICMQDAAIAPLADDGALAHARIDLPIDPRTATVLTVDRHSPGGLLARMGAVDPPWCFHVPGVRFRALSETLIAAGRCVG